MTSWCQWEIDDTGQARAHRDVDDRGGRDPRHGHAGEYDGCGDRQAEEVEREHEPDPESSPVERLAALARAS